MLTRGKDRGRKPEDRGGHASTACAACRLFRPSSVISHQSSLLSGVLSRRSESGAPIPTARPRGDDVFPPSRTPRVSLFAGVASYRFPFFNFRPFSKVHTVRFSKCRSFASLRLCVKPFRSLPRRRVSAVRDVPPYWQCAPSPFWRDALCRVQRLAGRSPPKKPSCPPCLRVRHLRSPPRSMPTN